MLRHLPPDTESVAVWNRPKGKWQERELGSPIALQENDRDVFIRVVGLSDSDCDGLPWLIQAATLAPKRARSPTSSALLESTSSPAKRIRSVNATSSNIPSTLPSLLPDPVSPSTSSGSDPLSGLLKRGPYIGLLGAPTFTPAPVKQRSANFPAKFSFAEVIRYLRRLDELISNDGMKQTAANAFLAGQLGVNCCGSNLGKIKTDLRDGDDALWRQFMAMSSTFGGSWGEYRAKLKTGSSGGHTEVVWATFPPEEDSRTQDGKPSPPR